MSHHRHVVTAPDAPNPVGPYSHAVRAGGLLFCSGQVGLDPSSGRLIDGGPGDQVRQCLENLQAVIRAGGAELADAVRMTVYVTDMGAFGEVNQAYGAFFEAEPPARVTIGVAALPGGADVEVDAVVALPD
jgi:2-iminobutanoate/2-iminopropanoate deaminase